MYIIHWENQVKPLGFPKVVQRRVGQQDNSKKLRLAGSRKVYPYNVLPASVRMSVKARQTFPNYPNFGWIHANFYQYFNLGTWHAIAVF